MIFIIIGGIIVVLLITVWVIYNSFVQAKNITEESFSGIDVQLKKRFELIPNLIEAVKGYNAHEAELLQKIVSMRGSNGKTIAETASADQSITSALKHFRIQVENYPDLKANTQFLLLMDNLSKVENELAMSRRYYNGTIRDYNTKIEKFPAVLIAKPLGFNEAEFYSIKDDNERIAPEVNLNN